MLKKKVIGLIQKIETQTAKEKAIKSHLKKQHSHDGTVVSLGFPTSVIKES